MGGSLPILMFVLHHILHWRHRLLCDSRKTSVNWQLCEGCRWQNDHSSLSERRSLVNTTRLFIQGPRWEIQQNGPSLTYTAFFIKAVLYIRAVTGWAIRRDVFALSPTTLYLFSVSHLIRIWDKQVFKTGRVVIVFLCPNRIVHNVTQGQEVLQPPHPYSSSLCYSNHRVI